MVDFHTDDFRLATTANDAVTALCETTAAAMCSIYFSCNSQEHLYSTDHSILDIISMEKRLVSVKNSSELTYFYGRCY